MITIKIVGAGCPTCQKLEALCREVVAEEGIEANIEKVTDVSRFADLGIFMTPGLIINDDVMSSGKMPTKQTLANWIKQAAA